MSARSQRVVAQDRRSVISSSPLRWQAAAAGRSSACRALLRWHMTRQLQSDPCREQNSPVRSTAASRPFQGTNVAATTSDAMREASPQERKNSILTLHHSKGGESDSSASSGALTKTRRLYAASSVRSVLGLRPSVETRFEAARAAFLLSRRLPENRGKRLYQAAEAGAALWTAVSSPPISSKRISGGSAASVSGCKP